MKRIYLWVTLVLLVSGCQTTRETQTNNIGTSKSTPVSNGFDKKQAAANRVTTGLTYLSRSNYQRAKFHLDRALEYDSDSGDVHFALGLYYQRVKEYKSAMKHFEEALDIDSRNASYLNAFGAFLCEKGEYERADKMFGRAINIPTYSEMAMVYFNVGFCALKQNNKERAEDYFRKTLNRDPKMGGALIEMAKLEFEKQRYERTIAYVKRFEQNANVTPESAWLGLRAAHFVGDKDSIARYSTILEQRFPDSEQTARYLDDKKKWM